MIVRISKAPLRKALRSIQAAFLVVATGLLGYCGYVAADAWNYQRRALREFDRTLAQAAHKAEPAALIETPRPVSASIDGTLGRIDVPRLGISVAVLEGTTGAILRRAAGHISGTALPGRPGNAAISAHRDTFFRPLRNIRRDDIITVTTLDGKYCYRVVSTKIVKPTDLSVLDSGNGEVLTLVTCYPFYFIGAAPSRFIVRAERVRPQRPTV